MTSRDWTPTDEREAAEDRRAREWWRRPDPFAEPDYREGPDDEDEDDDLTPRIDALHIETFCEKLRPRVAIRSGVEVAHAPDAPRSSWWLVGIGVLVVLIAMKAGL